MPNRMPSRRLAAAISLMSCLLIAGCVSSETVTFSDAAVAEATARAVAGVVPATPAPTDGGTTEPSEPTADSVDPDATAPADPTAPPATSGVSDGDCRFDSIDDFNDIQIELEFISTLTSQSDATVDYAVFDGNGDLIIESSTLVEALAPGEPVRLAIDTVEDAPDDAVARAGISCEFRGLEVFDFAFESFDPRAGDTCEFVELDFVGDIQLEVSVESPAEEPAELVVTIALRSGDGIRFADATGFTDTVDPGERTTADVDSLTPVPEWLDLDGFSCEVLSIEQF